MSFISLFRRFPWRDARYALWLPAYLLLFFALERIFSADSYWITDLPVDACIPFCEWFIIPYCIWYIFQVWAGIYTLRRDPAAFRRYMCYMAITFFASTLIWILIPNAQNLRPEIFPRDNFLSSVVAFLYSIDTNTNVFPSVHVVGALGAMMAFLDCRTLRGKHLLHVLIVLLALLICASTLFVKQHALLDTLAAFALALAVSLPLYRHLFIPAYRT